MGLQKLERKYLLLCEGMHDAEAIQHLAKDRGFGDLFQITSCGHLANRTSHRDGIGHLTQALTALPGLPFFERLEAILVVADNDDNPFHSFERVQGLIAGSNEISPGHRFAVPTAPLIKAGSRPAVVVMMVPWTGVPGALDTLCHQSASRKHGAVASAVEEFAAAVGSTTANGWPVTKQHKMRLRSLLSAVHMPDPYISPTWVWKDGTDLVPINDPAFDQISDFLQNFPAFLAAPG